MKRITLFRVLLWASAMALAPHANAQTAPVAGEAEPPADAPSPDDAALLTVPAEEMNATAADARSALLEAQIASLQAQLDDVKKQLPKALPTWKGASQLTDSAGWSFKVRGRFMLDASLISEPDNYVANRNLGFNARIRRFRIGVEGSMPGDFGYKAEVDYNNSVVSFGDVVLTYAPKGKPWSLIIGNQESNDGLEQMSSSRFLSFMERAQMNDAFGNTRRLGVNLGLQNSANTLRWSAGLFAAHTIDASINNDGWIGASRLTFAPFALGGQLHLGLNWQHREFQSNDNGVASTSANAPSTNQFGRYRARPLLQTTDVRFVDTGSFAAKGDDIFGLELASIFKSLHIASEAQWTKVRAYSAGDISTGRDAFAGGSGVTPTGDPTFFSAYAEIGYFLTGETRGYKNGTWDRTKVLNPFSKGGWGAVQLNARFDYLDLDTNELKNGVTNNFATGVTTLAALNSREARGGKQSNYQASVVWIPEDYFRFYLQYVHTAVEGGPFAALVKPLSTDPVSQRKYGVDSIAIRAAYDF